MHCGLLHYTRRLRSLHRLPRRGDKPEWQHSQDYLYERKALPSVDLTDPLFSYAD